MDDEVRPGDAVRSAFSWINGRSELAAAALFGLLASEFLLVLVATAHRWRLVPNGVFAFRSGVAWPFAGLLSQLPASHQFIRDAVVLLLSAMALSYLLLLAVGEIRKRWAVLALVVAYALVALAPALFSKDVYLYLAYSRLGVVYHLNPYVAEPSAITGGLAGFVTWKHQLSPYGPLFTLTTYPIGLASLTAGLWVLKLVTVAAALGCLAFVWKCARLLNLPATALVLAVGLNPLFLIYGVAGSHNDMLMMLAVLASVYLALVGRQRLSGLTAVAAIGVKFSAAAIAPFVLLIGRERTQRMRALVAATIGAGALVVASLLLFGPHVIGVVQQAGTVTRFSVPRLLAIPFGYRSGSACARHPAACHPGLLSGLSTVVFALVIVALLVWVVRGGDAITASGWAAFALVLTLTSIQTWYIAWVLPFAVLSRSRALRIATGFLAGFLFLTAWPISHVLTVPLLRML
jgi:Glycosyltransferase family 87